MEEHIGCPNILSDSFSKLDATYEKMNEQLALLKSALQSFIKKQFDIDIDFDALSESPSSSVNPVPMNADAQQVFDKMAHPNLGDVVEDQDDLVVSNENYSKVSLEDEVPNLFHEMPRSKSTAIIENQHVPIDVDITHIDAIGGEGPLLSLDSEAKCDSIMTVAEHTTKDQEIYDRLDYGVILLFDPGGYGFSFLSVEASTTLTELESQLLLVKIDVERYTKGTLVLCISRAPNMFLLVDETFQHYCGDFVLEKIIICVDIPVNWIYTVIEPNELLMQHILLSSGLGSRPCLFSLRIPMVLHNLYENQFLGNDPINCVSNMLSVPLKHHWFQILRLTDSGYYLEAASVVVSFASAAHGAFVSQSLNTIEFIVNTLMEKIVSPLSTNSLRLEPAYVKANPIVRFNYSSNYVDIEKSVNDTRKADAIFQDLVDLGGLFAIECVDT